MERFKSKPVLLKLFFPVRKLHLGHEAGQVIGRTFYEILMGRINRRQIKHDPAPQRVLARSVVSMLCKHCGGFKAMQELIKRMICKPCAALFDGNRRARGAYTLRGVQDATWMVA